MASSPCTTSALTSRRYVVAARVVYHCDVMSAWVSPLLWTVCVARGRGQPPRVVGQTVNLTAPMLSRPFALAVTANEPMFGADGSRYSLFTVSVECGDAKWSVKRRYSDFRNLHIKLRHSFANVKVGRLSGGGCSPARRSAATRRSGSR